MKIWHGYDWNEITSPNVLGKCDCDNCKFYGAYNYGRQDRHGLISKFEFWFLGSDGALTQT